MQVARRLPVPAALVIAVALLGASPGAVGASSPHGWTQFQFSAAHTGYNPHETSIGPSNVGSLAMRWATSFGEGNDFLNSPVVSGGRAYVQAWSGKLFALRASTGKILWSVPVASYGGGFSPALWGHFVIAAGQNDAGTVVAAYDRESGALRWRTQLSGQAWSATPVVFGNSIFLSTGAELYALSARTGHVLWKTTVTADEYLGGVWGPLAVSADGRHLLAAGLDGQVYDLSPATGHIRWQVQAGGGIYRGGPAIDGNVAFVPEGGSGAEGGGFDIVAMRISDGHVLWRGFAGDDVHTTPAVAYGLVFIGAIDTGFRALSEKTGVERWAIDSTPEVWSPVVIANGVAYQATESSLYAVNARTGQQLFWTEFGEGNANMASPAVLGGRVYLSSGDTTMRMLTLP